MPLPSPSLLPLFPSARQLFGKLFFLAAKTDFFFSYSESKPEISMKIAYLFICSTPVPSHGSTCLSTASTPSFTTILPSYDIDSAGKKPNVKYWGEIFQISLDWELRIITKTVSLLPKPTPSRQKNPQCSSPINTWTCGKKCFLSLWHQCTKLFTLQSISFSSCLDV